MSTSETPDHWLFVVIPRHEVQGLRFHPEFCLLGHAFVALQFQVFLATR
jgi:hypothetical protein